MSAHTPHELHDEFPHDAETLHRLKLNNPHFVKLADRHHEVNREIHRIDAGLEAAGDERIEALKRERLHLLDEVAAIIEQQGAASA